MLIRLQTWMAVLLVNVLVLASASGYDALSMLELQQVATLEAANSILGSEEEAKEMRAAYGRYAEKLLSYEGKFGSLMAQLHEKTNQGCGFKECDESALQSKQAKERESLLESKAFACNFPPLTPEYSLITKDNATVHANKVRTGLAVGGFLIDGTPTECGEVGGMSLVAERFVGLRWNFTELCIVGQPLGSKLFWPQYEFLAQQMEPKDYPGGYRVVVFTSGGTYNTESFYTDGLDTGITASGKNIMVVFNTDEDIVLDATATSQPFMATVLAPFSLVTLVARVRKIDGTIIAREFGGTLIAEDPGYEEALEELVGNTYEGPMTCTEEWTNPPSTSTAESVLVGCPIISGVTMSGCRCQAEWVHDGVTYECCARTPDRLVPWCPVVEGSNCESAAEELDGSAFWDECTAAMPQSPVQAPGTPAPGMPGTPGTMAPGTMAPATMAPGTPGTMMPDAPGTMAPGTPGTMAPASMAPGTMMPGTPGTMAPGTPGTMAPASMAPGTMMPGTPGTMAPGTPGTMAPVTETPATMMPGTPGTMAPDTMAPGTPGTMAPGTPGTMTPGTPGTMAPGTPVTMAPATPAATNAPGTGATMRIMPVTETPATKSPDNARIMPVSDTTTPPPMCVSNITEHNCKCQQTWMYGGEEKECCQYTPDHDKPWCYVVDGMNCPNSIKTSGAGGYWDNCAPYEPTTTTTTAMCFSNITEHGCACQQTWMYAGEDKHCCQYTPDNEHPWCYVVDGSECPGAIKTSGAGGYWDNCAPYAPTTTTTTAVCFSNVTEHGCACQQTWMYAGEDKHCCQYTPDNEYPWCYVVDGSECPGAIKTSGTGGYWDNCAPYAPTTTTTTGMCFSNVTEHGCACQQTWMYAGEDKHCCQYTPDNEHPWCYVVDGSECPGAIKTSGTGGYWDNCAPYAPTTTTTTGVCVSNITEHGCHCMDTWMYAGTEEHCCQYTPDNEHPWCYVVDGADCPGAIKTSGTGGYWDNCAPYKTTTTTTAMCYSNVTDHGCHCMDTWMYSGVGKHCCQRTPDNERPWCYVADGADCDGAIKTSGAGGYWDNCPEP